MLHGQILFDYFYAMRFSRFLLSHLTA